LYAARLFGFVARIEDRAALALEEDDRLDPRMRRDEVRHAADEGGIVDAPQAPFADRVRDAGMRFEEREVRVPLCPEVDVVEIVAHDVDVVVAG
jgi:hypothetical protein